METQQTTEKNIYDLSIGHVNKLEADQSFKGITSEELAGKIPLDLCIILFKLANSSGEGKIQIINGEKETTIKWRKQRKEKALEFTRTTERIKHQITLP